MIDLCRATIARIRAECETGARGRQSEDLSGWQTAPRDDHAPRPKRGDGAGSGGAAAVRFVAEGRDGSAARARRAGKGPRVGPRQGLARAGRTRRWTPYRCPPPPPLPFPIRVPLPYPSSPPSMPSLVQGACAAWTPYSRTRRRRRSPARGARGEGSQSQQLAAALLPAFATPGAPPRFHARVVATA